MSAISQKSLAGWLVVLIAGVGATVWQLQAPNSLHPGRHGDHQHAAQSGPQPMFSWQPHEAQRIELHTVNRSIDMVLSEAGWRDEPPGFDATAFVTMFSRTRADRSFEPMAGVDYGLEPGIMTLMVKDARGRVLADLIIGERLPDGLGRYVRGAADATVTVVPDYQIGPVLQAVGAASAVTKRGAGREPAQTQLSEVRPAQAQPEQAPSAQVRPVRSAQARVSMVMSHVD